MIEKILYNHYNFIKKINEDKLGFNTEELKCFCPSPFFWDIALE